MLFGFFYGDWTLILLIAAMIFAFVAQYKVKSTFDKYNRINNQSGLSGAEAARKILDSNGLYHVRVEFVRGKLTDHFDPRQNVVRLSESTYSSRSVAAVGVAAHEAGHAVQYARHYGPIKLRASILPITRIGSMMAMPIFIIGLLFTMEPLLLMGILRYSAVTLFQLLTLPVEFNASARAMSVLESSGILNDSELKASRKVLTAAAMTYVAALLTSLLTLLRLLILANGRRR